MIKKVWLVLVDDTHISHRHTTLESALAETERLIRLPENHGRGAIVLEAVDYAELVTPAPPILWTNLRKKEAAIPPDPARI